MPSREWDTARTTLTAGGLAWPEELMRHDLRWWASKVRLGYATRIPGARTLAEHWNVSRKVAARVMRNEALWMDPRFPCGEGADTGRPIATSGPTKGPPAQQQDEVINEDGPTAGHERAADGTQKGHTRVDTHHTTPHHKNNPPTPQAADATRGAFDPLSVLNLSGRVEKACRAAGLTTPEAMAALSPSELRKRPGIGAKAVGEVAAALTREGFTMQPDAPKKAHGHALTADEKAITDAWAAAWKATHDGNAYRWDLGPQGGERRQVQRVLSMLGSDGPETVERAAMAYLEAHARGEAWPHNEAPTMATFATCFRRWVDATPQSIPSDLPTITDPAAWVAERFDGLMTAWERANTENPRNPHGPMQRMLRQRVANPADVQTAFRDARLSQRGAR